MHARQLDQSDLEWVVEELRKLPSQSRYYADVPDDPEYVLEYFRSLEHFLTGSCIEEHGAFILGCYSKPWYADRLEAHEMILWVPEQWRGGRDALRLIRHWTNEMLTQPIHMIRAGHSLDITSAETTLRLYEMCGYTRNEHGGVTLRKS
ncbi:N-acyltransferase protein [Rhizobium phage RHph_I40]|uniref:N-acyltransferase protein n=1 Tax=Rhizobium phage RHph_I38 TaxID=2509734 RepID=A0A7S5R8R7_9CAUD|nr:N-acyltransferase protein [Rhizobium phage RHph_I38]QXV73661.1 N-acyltransferase protein [Rhizobium phage RHph_I40]